MTDYEILQKCKAVRQKCIEAVEKKGRAVVVESDRVVVIDGHSIGFEVSGDRIGSSWRYGYTGKIRAKVRLRYERPKMFPQKKNGLDIRAIAKCLCDYAKVQADSKKADRERERLTTKAQKRANEINDRLGLKDDYCSPHIEVYACDIKFSVDFRGDQAERAAEILSKAGLFQEA